MNMLRCFCPSAVEEDCDGPGEGAYYENVDCDTTSHGHTKQIDQVNVTTTTNQVAFQLQHHQPLATVCGVDDAHVEEHAAGVDHIGKASRSNAEGKNM